MDKGKRKQICNEGLVVATTKTPHLGNFIVCLGHDAGEGGVGKHGCFIVPFPTFCRQQSWPIMFHSP